MAMTAAIPINQAATPACLTISAPIRPSSRRGRLPVARSDQPENGTCDPADRRRTQASYQGDLMSKEWVAPTPNVSWFGVPRCSTSGELAASPVSRSYSTKAWVANCGVQK